MAEKKTVRKLLLVYNADSGTMSALVDSAKKVLKVNGCSLCGITHGLLGEKSEWRDCREELGVPVDYLHREELFGELKYLASVDLPCVLAQTDDGPELLLTADVLDRCRGSVGDFKARLEMHAAMRDLELPG